MLDQSYYAKTDEIIEHYGPKPASLIPIMQDIQAEYRYLSWRASDVCCIQDWSYRSKGLQCSHFL